MRKDKDVAISLRKEGKTYRQIEKELTVSRSTLCEWFKDLEWSKHIKKLNSDQNIFISKERVLALNKAREKKLAEKYIQAEKEAVEEYDFYSKDTLFHAGLMLYLGEGDKVGKWGIRIANTDIAVHKIFMAFLEKYLKIQRSELKFWLLLYPDLDNENCVSYWSNGLHISRNQFHKSQVIKGRESSKRLQFGVGNTIITNTFKKKKLLKWIELSKETLSAGMVQG